MMLPKFEIKYIDVQWHDKNTVLKVLESYLPLSVYYDDTLKSFSCTTTIYPKAEGIRLGQLAFRYLDDDTIAPHFEKTDGSRVQLKNIKDKDSRKSWWIEAVNWQSDIKQWTRTSIGLLEQSKWVLAAKAALFILAHLNLLLIN